MPDKNTTFSIEKLAQLRPIDDDFMRQLFRNNIPLAQRVLRIITGKDDLVITSEETQYDLKNISGARSVCLDVLATDSKGQKYDLEIQRADKGASPKRARYHSSAMDIEFLHKNEDFSQLPITYVIFITENDVIGDGLPIYNIDRAITNTGKLFDDGTHIIFINGEYNKDDDNSDLARLIHDFSCKNADDMYIEELAERTRYYKESSEGVSHMCKIIEDMLNENAIETARKEKIQLATKLLVRGKETIEEIAEDTGLTVQEVTELSNKIENMSV